MFEGIPNYPSMSRFWEVIDKHKVNIFYTAPTAIRSLMGAGEEPVKKTSRASLRLLGSVGEPINPEAWEWYYRVVGDSRCPIVDTWWQTETGGILITPLPGAIKLKPGSATRPFFGVIPEIVDAAGQVQQGATDGNLVIADSWPGQARTVYGDHARFVSTYFSAYPAKYVLSRFQGYSCRRACHQSRRVVRRRCRAAVRRSEIHSRRTRRARQQRGRRRSDRRRRGDQA
jgi:acetyl-CoA synthetase